MKTIIKAKILRNIVNIEPSLYSSIFMLSTYIHVHKRVSLSCIIYKNKPCCSNRWVLSVEIMGGQQYKVRPTGTGRGVAVLRPRYVAHSHHKLTLLSSSSLRPMRVMIMDDGSFFSRIIITFLTHLFFGNTDDEFGEKTVSVLLDGEESEMIFIDHASSEMSVSTFASRCDVPVPDTFFCVITFVKYLKIT